MHTVEEAMTAHVVTVSPEAPVTVAARIMRDVGVSGLPVVDNDGCVVGMLTEADLLHRAVVPDLPDTDTRRGSRDRASGSSVADLMSRKVLGLRRSDPLAKAARLMEKARVRRLVVVGDGFVLEGIISRSDVVAALARSDADIEAEIRSCVIAEVLGLDPDDIDVSVEQGVATVTGNVGQRREAVRLERLVGRILGVSRVESSVTWRADTRYPRARLRFAHFAEASDGTDGRSPPRTTTESHGQEQNSTDNDGRVV